MRLFLRDHFDKLLCAGLFLLMVEVVLGLSYLSASSEIIAWARELASGFQGALLGLITGIAIGKRLSDKDTN